MIVFQWKLDIKHLYSIHMLMGNEKLTHLNSLDILHKRIGQIYFDNQHSIQPNLTNQLKYKNKSLLYL